MGYRYATRPVTLTVAAGSFDCDAPRLMTAIASRLSSSNAHIRLKIVSKDSALEASKAFVAGETDLAIVRGDIGDVPAARALLRIANGVVMIIAPPGGNIEFLDSLKGKTIGVVGGEINRRVTDTLKKLGVANIEFKELAQEEVQGAIKAKQVQAVMIVIPISEKYLAMVRGIAPTNAKLKSKLLPIDAAEAIAAAAPYYESYELPKGTLRGVPPLPEEDMTTLRVPFYLVGKRTLSNDVATELTKAVMDARRDLVGEFPILSHISAPSTEQDAYIQPGFSR